jgi:NAD-dependent dihydropyrimidine dehydrogenase PreA subunit
VLQPADLTKGIDRLWTPWANADWAGCEPTCNNCGQVCPTGAIRALAMDQKKAVRMGLARVNERTCLHFNDRKDCLTHTDQGDRVHLICGDACPYDVIDVSEGYPVLMKDPSGNDLCIGCGMCQAACFAANVKAAPMKKLSAAAVFVEAGKDEAGRPREDRFPAGGPIRLRNGSPADNRGEKPEPGSPSQPGQPGQSGGPPSSQPSTQVEDVPYGD